jgi:hypothetical protein
VLGGATSAEEVARYAAKRKLEFPVLHDPSSLNAKAWDLGGVPHGLVLDRSGRVAWQGRIGPQEDSEGCEAAMRAQWEERHQAGTLAPP